MDDPIQAKQQSALNQAISKYNHITGKRKGLEKEAEAQIVMLILNTSTTNSISAEPFTLNLPILLPPLGL